MAMATATRVTEADRDTQTVTLTVRIKRTQPDEGIVGKWQEFRVEASPLDRFLDVLNKIKWTQDGTLTYRRSCAHGVCGSDAMRINRLACKILVADLGTKISAEPMLGYPVIRDLVVDMDPFFAKYEKIKPYLINDEPPPATERLQSPAQRERYDQGTKCILCGACTGSCPSVWANREWVGPHSIVNAHRFIFDSRDRGASERLQILADRTGVWRCRTIFNCAEVCPRGIPVTEL